MQKILLVDKHPLIRIGIRDLILDYEGYTVVGEASNGKEALTILDELSPDIIITNVVMPDLNGIQLTRQAIKNNPNVRVLILSQLVNNDVVTNAIDAGATGYLSKESDPNELIEALKAVSNGKSYFGKNISDILIEAHLSGNKKQDNAGIGNLSKRESEILKCVAKGLTSCEIGSELYISTRTVDTHRNNIIRKLNVKNTAQLINLAHNMNLLDSVNELSYAS